MKRGTAGIRKEEEEAEEMKKEKKKGEKKTWNSRYWNICRHILPAE